MNSVYLFIQPFIKNSAVLDKSLIVVTQAKEGTNVFYFGLGREESNSFYINFVRSSSIAGSELVQKLHRSPSKLTFVYSYLEMCLSDGL